MKKYIRKRVMYDGNIDEFMDILNKDYPDYRLVHFSVERIKYPTINDLLLVILEKEVEEEYVYIPIHGDDYVEIVKKQSNHYPDCKIIQIHQHRPGVFEALLEKRRESEK